MASRLRFRPDEALAEGTAITVAVSSKVVSYAGVPVAQNESEDATVVAFPNPSLQWKAYSWNTRLLL